MTDANKFFFSFYKSSARFFLCVCFPHLARSSEQLLSLHNNKTYKSDSNDNEGSWTQIKGAECEYWKVFEGENNDI